MNSVNMYVSYISKMNEWKKNQMCLIEGGENSSSDVYEEKGKVS